MWAEPQNVVVYIFKKDPESQPHNSSLCVCTLPIIQKINFKTKLLVYKVLKGSRTFLILRYVIELSRHLRSPEPNLLSEVLSILSDQISGTIPGTCRAAQSPSAFKTSHFNVFNRASVFLVSLTFPVLFMFLVEMCKQTATLPLCLFEECNALETFSSLEVRVKVECNLHTRLSYFLQPHEILFVHVNITTLTLYWNV